MVEILESIAPELWLIAAGVALLVSLLGFAIGRRTGTGATQIQELTGALDDARAEADGARAELDRYRGSVADHFADTSEKLRDLTLQYRSVYDHLAAGAEALCPEGFEQLEGGLTAALPESLLEDALETDDPVDPDSVGQVEADPVDQAEATEQDASSEEIETPTASGAAS